MTTPIAGLAEIAVAQSNKYLTHNEALRDLESLIFRANSMSTAAEPGSPTNGDVYILPASPTGTDWSTFTAGDVAVYNDSEWDNFTPWDGLSLVISDINLRATYVNSAWVIEPIGIGPLSVIDRGLAAEPGSPTAGDIYILPASPTGTNWASLAQHDIVISDGSTWAVITPVKGMLVYVDDEDVYARFTTSWSAGTAI